MEKSKNISFKIIAAGITLLLGIILAIGYPTGGVKPNNSKRHRVVVNHTPTTKQTVKKEITKKQEPKKHINTPVAPPSSTEESSDEGC